MSMSTIRVRIACRVDRISLLSCSAYVILHALHIHTRGVQRNSSNPRARITVFYWPFACWSPTPTRLVDHMYIKGFRIQELSLRELYFRGHPTSSGEGEKRNEMDKTIAYVHTRLLAWRRGSGERCRVQSMYRQQYTILYIRSPRWSWGLSTSGYHIDDEYVELQQLRMIMYCFHCDSQLLYI